MTFPRDFVWGAASSSYQVEGAAYRAEGGTSVWDMLGRQKGKIKNGDTGEIACDHYNRYPQDVALMSEIGLQAYRFSISWPRVMPDGTGHVNVKGLDFYSRLVDELLERDIDPWVTLFHWDFPYPLFCKGGWLDRDCAQWFVEFAEVVVDRLSDRVSHWMPLNEPECFIGLGHQQGNHAPGLKLGFSEVLLAGHHALLAHGKTVRMIRSCAQKKPCIGTAAVGKISMPDSCRQQDIDVARSDMFAVKGQHFFNNSWFGDPVVLGHYPAQGVRLFESFMPAGFEKDMEIIQQPIDFYGVNIYTGSYVRASSEGTVETVEKPRIKRTAMDWAVTPEALYWGPKFLHERYNLPVVITENGMANPDQVDNGKIDDRQRIDFLHDYIHEFGRAIAAGVPARGYFLWSIVDNFEWAEGYAKKFGIIHIDYETQKRTLKESAYWYRDVIAANGCGNMKRHSATEELL